MKPVRIMRWESSRAPGAVILLLLTLIITGVLVWAKAVTVQNVVYEDSSQEIAAEPSGGGPIFNSSLAGHREDAQLRANHHMQAISTNEMMLNSFGFVAACPAQKKLAGVGRAAVFSTTSNPFYSFHAPITAWAWKHRIGYTPVVLVTEDIHPYVVRNIEEAGGIVVTVGWELDLSITPSALQTSRVLAAALPFPNNTVIVTGDADMIPIMKSYFHTYNTTYKFHALNGAAAYPNHEYPMCYMLAQASVWRRIIGYKEGDTVDDMIQRLMEDNGVESFQKWNFDQALAYRLVQQAAQSDAYFVEVLGHGLRQDRASWRPYIEGHDIDSHALRPGFTPENWHLVSTELLRHIMGDAALSWAMKYRDDYVEIVRGGDPERGMLTDGLGRLDR